MRVACLPKQAHGRAAGVFVAGVDTQSVKLAIKKLTAHAVQRSRPKLSMGMIGKLKLLGASSKKKARCHPLHMCIAILRCMHSCLASPCHRTHRHFYGAHTTVWITQGGRRCRCRCHLTCCRAGSLSDCRHCKSE